ncbi:MAG: hypothetical protein M0Z38_04895 [Deltaproteobacteria bacterium]|nr:hypothetical protein [Deltaproteobacteria bacterium]
MKRIYLQHTTVSPSRSVQEIIDEITMRGATQVRQDYGPNRSLLGLYFSIDVNGTQLPVELPARIAPMKVLLKRELGPRARQNEEKIHDMATRIVWRQLSAWVRAQMALVDLQMAKPEEVFLPFIQVAPGRSVFNVIAESGFKMRALNAPKEEK